MRCVVEPGRSPRLFRLAIFATIAVAAVSCSDDTHRFKVNPFNAKAPQPSQDVTGSVSQNRSSVQSAPLPPPTAGKPATVASAPAKQPTAPPGWNWSGGTAIIVQKGDTIDGLVARHGVPASAIAEANNIPNGTALRPGQRLVIPKYEATGSTLPRPASHVPPAAAPAIAPVPSGSQHVHVVAPGETLMALSRKYHKPLGAIAKANNIEPHTMVKVGDRIVIPGAGPQAGVKRSAASAPLAQAPVSVSAPKVAS